MLGMFDSFCENVNLSADVRGFRSRIYGRPDVTRRCSLSLFSVDRQYDRRDMNEKYRAVSIEMAQSQHVRSVTLYISKKI